MNQQQIDEEQLTYALMEEVHQQYRISLLLSALYIWLTAVANPLFHILGLLQSKGCKKHHEVKKHTTVKIES